MENEKKILIIEKFCSENRDFFDVQNPVYPDNNENVCEINHYRYINRVCEREREIEIEV